MLSQSINWRGKSLQSGLTIAALAVLLAACSSGGKPKEGYGVEAPVISEQLQARYDEAVALLKQGELSAAESSFKNLLSEKKVELAGVHLNLAIIYYQNKELEKARQHVTRALEISPYNERGHNLLGNVLLEQEKFLEAAEAFTQAVSFQPDYAMAHLNLALVYDLYLDEWPKAMRHYKRYLSETGNEDVEVAAWANDLKIRMKLRR